MTPSDAAALGGGWCGGAADHDGFFEQPKRTDGRVAIDDCGTAVAATALRMMTPCPWRWLVMTHLAETPTAIILCPSG